MKKINLEVSADQLVLLYNLIKRAKSCPIADYDKGFYRMDLSMIIDETQHDTIMDFDVFGSISQ